ncbi:MAG: hypothetical protein LC772_06590 [Chloroflexi bacterium]|nr:hypothetical protein [Chloroflexota bacterium]
MRKKSECATIGKTVPHTKVGGKPQMAGEPLVQGSTVYGKPAPNARPATMSKPTAPNIRTVKSSAKRGK